MKNFKADVKKSKTLKDKYHLVYHYPSSFTYAILSVCYCFEKQFLGKIQRRKSNAGGIIYFIHTVKIP